MKFTVLLVISLCTFSVLLTPSVGEHKSTTRVASELQRIQYYLVPGNLHQQPRFAPPAVREYQK